MAIYAVGAYYDQDVSNDFIKNNIAGPGWSEDDAPELFQFINSLKVGDIMLVTNSPVVSAGRNVKWIITSTFKIEKPREKNNVRLNTMYEEFHPRVQKTILERLFNTKVNGL